MALASYCETSSGKLDLFNLWCDSSRCWDAVKVEAERKTMLKNRSKKGFEAIQGKVLKERLTAEKFAQIVASRKSTGVYYEDDDFPGDDDDSRLTIRNDFVILHTFTFIYCENLSLFPFEFPLHFVPFPLTYAFTKETWFFMRSATKFIREDSTSEALKLSAKAQCDAAMKEALTDPEQGILKAGLLPQVDTACPNGAKQLLGAITQAHMWDVGMAW